jgi:hypothetical protein
MRARALAAALLAPLLLAPLAGCAQSVDPIERLGKKAAQRVGPHGTAVAGHRGGGLPAPLAPTPGLPQVVGHVPTRDKVVFLTDGAAYPGTPAPRESTGHLTPGAVVRADPGATPSLLRAIRAQGFKVARLKDYR